MFEFKPMMMLAVTEIYMVHAVRGCLSYVAFQRKEVEVLTKEIVKKFDVNAFGTLLVCKDKGSGRYHLIDGQHRYLSAKELGIASVPCIMVGTLTKQEQIALFLRVNEKRRPIKKHHSVHLKALSGSPREQRAFETLKRQGFHFGDSMSKNVLCCEAACVSVIVPVKRAKGDELEFASWALVKTLMFIRCFDKCSAQVTNSLRTARAIKAIGLFFKLNRLVVPRELASKMESMPIQEWKSLPGVDRHSLIGSGSASDYKNFTRCLVYRYNYRRKKDRAIMPL